MRLISNWKRIAAKAHSMWAIYLGVFCLILPDVIYFLAGRDTNPRFWFFLALSLFVYGAIFRLKDQGIDRNTLKSPAIVAVIAVLFLAACEDVSTASKDGPLQVVDTTEVPSSPVSDPSEFAQIAVPLIARWEGLRLEAYLDIVGKPTVCFGETKGVKMGDSYTEAECVAMLSREVQDYRERLHTHFTAKTIADRLPSKRDAAYTSLAYNAGVGAVGKSTAVRRLNGGDIAGGCQALGWWNKAGGRVIRGLVNRRAEEVALCLEDLAMS